MLFIRTALVVGAGILLVPTDEAQQAKFRQNAAAAAGYVSAFCDRNPGTCATGREYWGVFKHKAEIAGGMALDLAKDRILGPAQPSLTTATADQTRTPSTSVPAPTKVHALEISRQGTLTRQDVEASWRGPKGL